MSRLFPDDYYKFSDEQKVEPHFKFEEEDFKKIEEMERRETKRRFDDAVRMLEARKRSAQQSPRKAPLGFARLLKTDAGKPAGTPAGPRPSAEQIRPEAPAPKQKAAAGQKPPAARQTASASRQGAAAPRQTASAPRQGAPAARQTAPAARQGAPAMKQSAPAAKHGAAGLRQIVPAAKQGGAVLRQGAPAGRQPQRPASPRMTNRAQLRLAQSPAMAKAHASPWKLQAAMLGIGLAAFAMTFAVCSRILPRIAAF